MAYEMLVGIEVNNNEIYQKYRDAMAPVLKEYGGEFKLDFVVSETLKPLDKQKVNRVFALSFKDEKTKVAFFKDPEYLKAKETYFDISVADATMFANYTRET